MTSVWPLPSRKLLISAILAASCSAVSVSAHAEATLLIEAETGRVLQAENATHPWYPASVTKLMTAYVALRAMKERRITADTLLTVSATAAAQAPSKMGFKPGTTLTVDNALKMMMVKSANDVAMTLAEGVAGSLDRFLDQANGYARRLGMTQTSYVNPNGLPADGQVTSARDLAILARALIREFPEYDHYLHTPAIKFGKRVMRNYNSLIDRYPGADGMKTGFICASGFNLVASATRNGRRLIAVVLGAPSGPVRAVKAAQLLETGFTSSGLSWLTPSLGTVDQLQPINAAPPNLREETCGKNRKRPAADDEDTEDTVASHHLDSGANFAVMLSNLRAPAAKPSSLLGPLVPSAEPVVVFVGPGKKIPGTQVVAAPARPTPPAPRAAATLPGQIAPATQPAAAPVNAASFAPASASSSIWTPPSFVPEARAAADAQGPAVPMPRKRPKPGAAAQ